MKGIAYGLLICLAASACSSEEERPPLTPAELRDPKACKDCHPKHYREWSASMHAYAMKDPVFIAMNKRGQQETHGELKEFCVNCHAPMAVRDDAIHDYADLSGIPEPLQGVTCYFCHTAVGVGDDHVNANIQLGNDNIMRGSLSNAIEPSTHRVQYSAFHDRRDIKSSLLCGTCHDIRTPRGVALERTLQEYQTSVFADPHPGICSCQGCHMDVSTKKQEAALSTGRPNQGVGQRNVHDHLWPGVDVPLTDFPHADALRAAVENCQLQAQSISVFDPNPTSSPLRFEVYVESQAGHNQPSGASLDRRMWIELVAFDASSNLLYEEGVVPDGTVEDPPEKRHPFMLRDYAKDETDHEAHMFWDVASYTASTLPTTTPGNLMTAHGFAKSYAIRPGVPVARYEMRIRMRPIGVDVLQDLVNSGHLDPGVIEKMPTFTVATKVFSSDFKPVPDGEVSSFVRELNPDCNKWKCLMDATSPDCQDSATKN